MKTELHAFVFFFLEPRANSWSWEYSEAELTKQLKFPYFPKDINYTYVFNYLSFLATKHAFFELLYTKSGVLYSKLPIRINYHFIMFFM